MGSLWIRRLLTGEEEAYTEYNHWIDLILKEEKEMPPLRDPESEQVILVATEAITSRPTSNPSYQEAVILVRQLVTCSHRLHYHLHEISEGKPVRFVDKAAVQMTLNLRALNLLNDELETPATVALAISYVDQECEQLRLSR